MCNFFTSFVATGTFISKFSNSLPMSLKHYLFNHQINATRHENYQFLRLGCGVSIFLTNFTAIGEDISKYVTLLPLSLTDYLFNVQIDLAKHACY